MRLIARSLLALLLVVGVVGFSFAAGVEESGPESYPTREIVLLVPARAGGGTDLVGRIVAKLLEEELGVPVAVENRPGAGGVVALNELVASGPDGYTMAVWANRGMMTASLLGEGANFDEDSFIYLAGVNATAELIIMPPDSPIDSAEEFVAAAKANPGSITIALPGTGPLTSYIMAQQSMGVDLTPVVYGGGSETMPAILGGHVDAGILSAAFAETMREQGATIIGVSSSERLESIPDIPTFVEQGYEGFVDETTRIFMVPEGTPEERVQILSDAFDSIADGRLQEELRAVNEVPRYRGREEIQAFLNQNFPIYREIIVNNREVFVGN